MRTIIIFLIMLPAISFAGTYTVSSKALNSITCPDGLFVSDVFFSEKMPIQVDYRKDKLFVEFIGNKETFGEVSYASEPASLVLFCGDEEHNLTLYPKAVNNASNIILEPITPKYIEVLDGLKREEQIVELVKAVFTDNIKSSRTATGEIAEKLGDCEVYLRKTYIVRSYKVKELYIFTPQAATAISEEALISLSFINNPIAISLMDTSVGWSRAVVIEGLTK